MDQRKIKLSSLPSPKSWPLSFHKLSVPLNLKFWLCLCSRGEHVSFINSYKKNVYKKKKKNAKGLEKAYELSDPIETWERDTICRDCSCMLVDWRVADNQWKKNIKCMHVHGMHKHIVSGILLRGGYCHSDRYNSINLTFFSYPGPRIWLTLKRKLLLVFFTSTPNS